MATPDHLALLSTAERTRYAAYRREEDRLRFLTGRVLAKTLIADRLGTTPADIEFDATCPDCGRQHGRPHLPGTALTFSISHSGQRIGVALTSGGAVGLDVEETSRNPQESLISYVLNDTELAALRDLSPTARSEAFLTYWTRKEAVMKATGLGLRLPLRDLVLSGPDQHPQLLVSEHDALSPETTSMADLGPGPGYRAAVAILGTGPIDATGTIDVTERWWTPRPDSQ